MYVPLSLILCREFGGSAVPVARITNRGILRVVAISTARAKRREAATTTYSFQANRLNREAEEIETLAK